MHELSAEYVLLLHKGDSLSLDIKYIYFAMVTTCSVGTSIFIYESASKTTYSQTTDANFHTLLHMMIRLLVYCVENNIFIWKSHTFHVTEFDYLRNASSSAEVHAAIVIHVPSRLLSNQANLKSLLPLCEICTESCHTLSTPQAAEGKKNHSLRAGYC